MLSRDDAGQMLEAVDKLQLPAELRAEEEKEEDQEEVEEQQNKRRRRSE